MARRRLCVLAAFLATSTLGGTAFGQGYIGDNMCKICHPDKYAAYMSTGHPWMLVKTNGADPPLIEYPSGADLPALPAGLSWSDINYVVGNFNGTGQLVDIVGDLQPGGSPYGGCVKCHTTGYEALGWTDNIPGSWAQAGIRCEECHGAGASDHDGTQVGVAKSSCVTCHYAGDGVDDIDFDPVTMQFGHGPQGEQFNRSAHRQRECTLCHSIHKSVWLEQAGAVKRCGVDCHRTQPVNGVMGWILDCEECHMQDRAHVVQITGEAITASENTHDIGGETYMNVDGLGAAYMTLDQVCYRCHTGAELSFEDLVAYAPTIHECLDDDYEDEGSDVALGDDSCFGTAITLCAEPQAHAHCDEDWVWFEVKAGATYTIETMNLTGGADTVIELYENCTNLLQTDDDSGAGVASKIVWQAQSDGYLDLRILDKDAIYDCCKGYGLQVSSTDCRIYKVFQDGFESGDSCTWSMSEPADPGCGGGT